MAIWDYIKKNIKEVGNVAAEKAEELGKVAATKTEELTKVGKVKLEIHQLDRDLEKCFVSIGRFVFDSTENENVSNFTGNDTFFKFVEEAKDIKETIKGKEVRLEEIKNEYSVKQEESEAPESLEQIDRFGAGFCLKLFSKNTSDAFGYVLAAYLSAIKKTEPLQLREEVRLAKTCTKLG